MRFLLWILFPFSCSADQGQSECPPDHWSNYGFCNAFGNPGLQCNAHCKPRLVICQAPNEVMKVRLITWSAYEWTCDLRMELVGFTMVFWPHGLGLATTWLVLILACNEELLPIFDNFIVVILASMTRELAELFFPWYPPGDIPTRWVSFKKNRWGISKNPPLFWRKHTAW